MLLSTFTLFHVALSLLGIGSGFIVLHGFLTSKWSAGRNTLYLTSTLATSITGFLFPVHRFLPSHAVGILSLIVLGIAMLSWYRFHLAGPWRRTYVVTALTALYFNVFVLVFQMFEKIPALKTLAPTQSEAPFKVTQLIVLVMFILLSVRAAARLRQEPRAAI